MSRAGNSLFINYVWSFDMAERISFAEIPEQMIECMMTTERYLKKCGFSKDLLALVRLRTSQVNACAYCIDMHYKEAIAAGVTPLRLYSLPVWHATPFYSEEEQAVLAWTEAVTLLPEERVSRELGDVMLTFFNKMELANLTMVIVQMNSWNRLMKAFEIEPGHYQIGSH